MALRLASPPSSLLSFLFAVLVAVGGAVGREWGLSSGEQLWCVAKNNAKDGALQAAIDWACGSPGGANYRAIQQGAACCESATRRNSRYKWRMVVHVGWPLRRRHAQLDLGFMRLGQAMMGMQPAAGWVGALVGLLICFRLVGCRGPREQGAYKSKGVYTGSFT